MAEVFVGIGTNIEREKNLASALAALETRFGPLTCSSVYETEAVGFVGDPFLNAVVAFDSDQPIPEITRQLADIEQQHGRSRDSRKFSPRTLDLDLLLYGDAILQHDRLKLPRDEVTDYAFVLEPMAELAPDLRHPVLGRTYAELWAAFDKQCVRQRRVAPPGPVN